MAFADLFQNLDQICKSDFSQRANDTTSTQEETLFGDVTEPYLTHLNHGEALENIKSEAKVSLQEFLFVPKFLIGKYSFFELFELEMIIIIPL